MERTERRLGRLEVGRRDVEDHPAPLRQLDDPPRRVRHIAIAE